MKQNGAFKTAEQRLMKISDELGALHRWLGTVPGAEQIRLRVYRLDEEAHAVRGALFDLSQNQ